MHQSVAQHAPALSGDSTARSGNSFRTVIAPLALLIVTPPIVIVLWIACRYLDGSLLRLIGHEGLTAIGQHFPRPTLRASLGVGIFAAFELVLLRSLPGDTFE